MGIYDRSYYREEGLRPVSPWDQRSAIAIIIIANVAVQIANYVLSPRSSAITSYLWMDPSRLGNPLEWYRVLTYGFAHSADIKHILFNMLSLYFLGRSVEDRIGKSEFIRFYLTAILLGGLYFAFKPWGDPRPMLGASGGVTAVCMLFVFFFPTAQIYMFGLVPTPAWVYGIIVIVMNVLGGSDGVAYDVHLVGAAFAAVYFFGGWNLAFLGAWFNKMQLSMKQRQRGLKVLRPEEPEATSKDEVEADRILAKIHQSGQDSLTKAERKFMEEYSQRVRQRRSKTQ
jgi:membrane associated rhomboid family serine protease